MAVLFVAKPAAPAKNPSSTIHLGDGADAQITEGTQDAVGYHLRLGKFAGAACLATYRPAGLQSGSPPGGLASMVSAEVGDTVQF